jgi:hypothetical protein
LESGNGKVSCDRCHRDLEPIGEAGVSVLLFAQTTGIKPRQKSAARQLRFCPACAVSVALGPCPEGSVNLLAWFALRELAGGDPALSSAAYQSLHRLLDLPAAQPALDS